MANDADDFTTLDLKRDVLERPDRFAKLSSASIPITQELASAAKRGHDDVGQSITQGFIGLPTTADPVLFAEIFYTERNITHQDFPTPRRRTFFPCGENR